MPPYMYMNIYVMSNATLHYPALIINSYSFECKNLLHCPDCIYTCCNKCFFSRTKNYIYIYIYSIRLFSLECFLML